MGFWDWLPWVDDAEDVEGPGDDFEFSESAAANVNPVPAFVRDAPPPGAAVVIVLDEDKNELAKDTFQVPEPAPNGGLHLDGNPATFHNVGATGNAHQEVLVRPGAQLPFEIPDYLRRESADCLRVLWSCEDE